MKAQDRENSIKMLVILMGVASTSVLISHPASALTNPNPNSFKQALNNQIRRADTARSGQILAQTTTGTTVITPAPSTGVVQPGTTIVPSADITAPAGSTVTPNNPLSVPAGTPVSPSTPVTVPQGSTVITPNAAVTYPPGTVVGPTEGNVLPSNTTVVPGTGAVSPGTTAQQAPGTVNQGTNGTGTGAVNPGTTNQQAPGVVNQGTSGTGSGTVNQGTNGTGTGVVNQGTTTQQSPRGVTTPGRTRRNTGVTTPSRTQRGTGTTTPGNTSSSGQQSAFTRYMLAGYAANQKGDYQTALFNFRRALNERPGNSYATKAIRNVESYMQRQR
jgi:hypothetical protein